MNLQIAYLDPIDLLHPVYDYVNEIDIHWNNHGHQKIGTLLSDCIESFISSGSLSDCDYVVMPEAEV